MSEAGALASPAAGSGASRLAPLLVFAAALALFGAGLTGRDLWHIDEHRYAEVARVMAEPGGELLVPHLNGNEYPDKPPLFFWLVAALHGALGLDLATAAKLPSVVGAAGAVALVFSLGRRLYGPRAGLAAAAVLATTSEFEWLARRANLDALMTFFATLGIFAFARVAFPAPGERARAAWGALGLLTVGVGSLVKGPAALALPASAVLAFALAAREPRVALAACAGLPLALAPIAAWLGAAWAQAGPQYARAIAIGQWLAHPAGLVDKREPWWFYLEVFPVTALPWTLLLPAAVYGLARWRRPGSRRPDLFAGAWLLAQLVVLSLSSAKRNLYVMPALPAFALLVGRWMDDVAAGPAARLRHALASFGRYPLAAIGLAAGALAVAGALLVLTGADGRALHGWAAWPVLRPEATAVRALLGLALGAAVAAASWRALVARDGRTAVVGLAVANLAGALLVGAVLLPIADPGKAARPFVEAIAPQVGAAPLADFGGVDFAANWVLRRDVVPALADAKAVEAFLAETRPAESYVITSRRKLRRSGTPAGTRVVLRWPLVLDRDELVLLARAEGTDARPE